MALAYLVSWYSGAGIIAAQTVAFVTWMIGHVLLAFNLRSEREPLFKIGLFSNPLMLVWAVATVIFVLLVTFVPFVQSILKTAPLSPGQWGLAIGTAIIGTFWLEIRKVLFGSKVTRPS